MRPWQTADGAAAKSRASARIAAASMPVRGRRDSGGKSAPAARGSCVESRRVRLRARPGAAQALGEEHVQQREQQQRVRARADEVVSVGDLGRLGAARVDHHEPAAARAQRLEARADVGRRHQAAVRRDRVGAEEQQELRAVDVGDGQQELVAEHPAGHQVVRQLVDRGGGEVVARAEPLQEVVGVRHQCPSCAPSGCRGRRRPRRGRAFAHRVQPCGGIVERLLPADLAPGAADRAAAGGAAGRDRPAGP